MMCDLLGEMTKVSVSRFEGSVKSTKEGIVDLTLGNRTSACECWEGRQRIAPHRRWQQESLACGTGLPQVW